MLGFDPLSQRPVSDIEGGGTSGVTTPLTKNNLVDNPVRRKQAGLMEVAQGLLLTTLAVAAATATTFRLPLSTNPVRAVAKVQPFNNGRVLVDNPLQIAPFAQEDWPNPVRVVVRQQDGGHQVTRLVLSGALPNNQKDWPNPSTKKLLQQPEVVGTSLVLGAVEPLPKNTYDWPNPIQPRRALQEGTQGYLPALIPVETPVALTRLPTVRTLPAIPRALQEATLGRLPDSIPSGVQPPFAQEDWTNPLSAKKVPQADSLGRLPSSIPRLPFPAQDWQNPLLRKATQQPELVGTRLVLGATDPLPKNIYDWPNPIQPRRALQESSQGYLPSAIPPPVSGIIFRAPTVRTLPAIPRALQEGTLGRLPNSIPSGTPPFFQTEWPNPVLAKNALQEGTLGRLANIPRLPFPSQDWPNPTGRKPGQGESLGRLPSSIVAAAPPFYRTDWPNPVQPRRALQEGTLGRLANLPPAPVVTRPFSVVEWWYPTRNKALDPSQQFEATVYVSAPTNSAVTRVPTITQIPRRRVPEQVGTLGRNPALIPPPATITFPFRNTDWPAPRKKPGLDPSQQFEMTIYIPQNLPTGAVTRAPVVTQIPKRRQPEQVGTAGRNPALIPPPALLVLPFSQKDWPVPKGRVAARPETTLGRFPNLPVPALLVLPFRQLDWPNPTLRKVVRQSFTNYVVPTVSGVWNTIEPCTGAGWSNAAPSNTGTWSDNSISDSASMTSINPCSPQTWDDTPSSFPNTSWEDVDDI